MDREERVCTWRGSAKVVTNRPTNITAAMGPTEAIVKMPKPAIGSVVSVFRLSEKELSKSFIQGVPSSAFTALPNARPRASTRGTVTGPRGCIAG
jgi:hypothetical protein